MKVRIFKDRNDYQLEAAINTFLKDNNIRVVDIKWAITENLYTALVIFENN